MGSSAGASNVSALVAADPSSANPIIGYQLLNGFFPQSRLDPGTVLNTTDILKQFSRDDEDLQIDVTSSGEAMLSGVWGGTNIHLCGLWLLFVQPDTPTM